MCCAVGTLCLQCARSALLCGPGVCRAVESRRWGLGASHVIAWAAWRKASGIPRIRATALSTPTREERRRVNQAGQTQTIPYAHRWHWRFSRRSCTDRGRAGTKPRQMSLPNQQGMPLPSDEQTNLCGLIIFVISSWLKRDRVPRLGTLSPWPHRG